MKTPVILVTVALTVAILLAASLVIATGTRGETAPVRPMPVAAAHRHNLVTRDRGWSAALDQIGIGSCG
jgi:hypothetical protein